MTAERLERIEEKVDKMSEAIVSLARMEERMITLFKRMDNYDAQILALMERLSRIEMAVSNMHGSNKWVDRVVWVAIAAGLTLLYTSK
jgi:hypothetical protein